MAVLLQHVTASRRVGCCPPSLMIEIPADRIFKGGAKLVNGHLSNVVAELGIVERIASIVATAITDKAIERSRCLAAGRRGHSASVAPTAAPS